MTILESIVFVVVLYAAIDLATWALARFLAWRRRKPPTERRRPPPPQPSRLPEYDPVREQFESECG